MSLTREQLLATYPKDKDLIGQISDDELDKINKYLRDEIPTHRAAVGSTISIKASVSGHTLDTTGNNNDGSGTKLNSRAKGYMTSTIPALATGTAYSVTLSGTTINLYASGATYPYISTVGDLAASSASGTIS